MEFILLTLLGIVLIVILVQSSKLSEVLDDLGDLKADVRESLELMRQREKRGSSREVEVTPEKIQLRKR